MLRHTIAVFRWRQAASKVGWWHPVDAGILRMLLSRPARRRRSQEGRLLRRPAVGDHPTLAKRRIGFTLSIAF